MPQNRKEKHSSVIHTPHTSHDEGLLGATMCHGSLCDLYQHCKHSFLRKANKVKTSKTIPAQFCLLYKSSSRFNFLSQLFTPLPAGRNIDPQEYTRPWPASAGLHPIVKGENIQNNELWFGDDI